MPSSHLCFKISIILLFTTEHRWPEPQWPTNTAMPRCLIPVKAPFSFWHWNEMMEHDLRCYLLLRLKWLSKYHWAQGTGRLASCLNYALLCFSITEAICLLQLMFTIRCCYFTPTMSAVIKRSSSHWRDKTVLRLAHGMQNIFLNVEYNKWLKPNKNPLESYNDSVVTKKMNKIPSWFLQHWKDFHWLHQLLSSTLLDL